MLIRGQFIGSEFLIWWTQNTSKYLIVQDTVSYSAKYKTIVCVSLSHLKNKNNKKTSMFPDVVHELLKKKPIKKNKPYLNTGCGPSWWIIFHDMICHFSKKLIIPFPCYRENSNKFLGSSQLCYSPGKNMSWKVVNNRRIKLLFRYNDTIMNEIPSLALKG